jgi:hypothetical protein
MSKLFAKSLLASPVLLGAMLAIAAPGISAESQSAKTENASEVLSSTASALQPMSEASSLSINLPVEQKLAQALPAAQPSANPAADSSSTLNQINQYVREGRSNRNAQVTSVSQFSDVKPTDWAFQALQSLVERYGCIVGYPDKTYRGNRAMTRYEFAAGLNACLDKIQELIAAATADFVKKEDLEVVKRLQEEFAAELAALRGRVEALEVRTATLEKQQFSTTTKLSGEVIFSVADEFAQPGNNETVFQNRVRLTLSSSFSGRDRLIVRLAAGNANLFNEFDKAGNRLGGMNDGALTVNTNTGGNNSVSADWVAYYFPIGENIQVYIPAINGLHYDLVPTNSGFMEDYDGGNGALSLFAQRNPIYSVGGGAGAAITFGVGKPISLSLSYLSSTANNPSRGAGLFDGNYSALAQVTFAPNDKFSAGLTYVNAFQKDGAGIFNGNVPLIGTGLSNFALDPLTRQRGIVVNGGGFSAAYKLSDTFSINGWVSYFSLDALRDARGDFDVWTYALGLSFADFGKKGNLLGLLAGTPPYRGNRGEVPIHVEGFYRIRLSDNISVTPGVVWVINQGQTNDKDALIGTVRTTFTF